MDLGGIDSYPVHCAQAHNNRSWSGARRWPELKLRSEAAAGVDGEFELPFFIRPRTR
jgi:hypothetical protein